LTKGRKSKKEIKKAGKVEIEISPCEATNPQIKTTPNRKTSPQAHTRVKLKTLGLKNQKKNHKVKIQKAENRKDSS
jgi:hypothetical protein